MKLSNLKHVYFIGIGGIGMSALARYFKDQNIRISGYDRTETALTKKLVEEGMKIHYDDSIRKIPEGIDLVVLTPAIPAYHEELNYFRRNFYQVKKRAEILGLLSRDKKTIAVGGTHGKTSTSSMIAHLLNESSLGASALIGGIMTNYNSNYISSKGDWIVVEADEYDRSFLQLSPDIAIITSVDPDHLDIYSKREKVVEGFESFIRKIKDGGTLLIKEGLLKKLSNTLEKDLVERQIEIFEYGSITKRFQYSNIRFEATDFRFDYSSNSSKIESIKMSMPGKHNVENATAAISVGTLLGLNVDEIKNAFESFKGIKRRYEFVVNKKDLVYIDDYAHHPSELKAAIETTRKLYQERKITGVFQPHLYSRTRDFAEEFANVLDELDEIILLEIYPAREEKIVGVSAGIIFEKIKNKNKILIQKEELLEHLKAYKIEVLLTLGAGNIDMYVEKIKELLN